MPASDPDHAKTVAALTAAQRYYLQDLTMDAIAAELGVTHDELVVARRIQRAEIAAIFLAARARTGEEVSRAARAAWRGLYGVELPPLALAE